MIYYCTDLLPIRGQCHLFCWGPSSPAFKTKKKGNDFVTFPWKVGLYTETFVFFITIFIHSFFFLPFLKQMPPSLHCYIFASKRIMFEKQFDNNLTAILFSFRTFRNFSCPDLSIPFCQKTVKCFEFRAENFCRMGLPSRHRFVSMIILGSHACNNKIIIVNIL